MINRTLYIILSIIFLSLCSSASAVVKKNISITKVNNLTKSEIRVGSSLSAADTCIVRHDQGVVWQINGWIVGNELYKSYMDPSLSCLDPYPFSVTEINMPMIFTDSTTMIISVDVEQVDYSNPNCPFPDTVMLGISSAYQISIPGAGFYDIWIPLDVPVVVNGPFFAGYFIGDISNPNSSPAPVTDSNLASICVSYNVWDDSIGFIDLMNNSMYNFPGQLNLYASGITGGNSLNPAPSVSILAPEQNLNAYKTVTFWAEETSGSNIIDYVSFSYAIDSNYIEIARDYDGTKPFRDGINPSSSGDGYSYVWDFSTVPQGTYNIKVTVVDTLGRSASDYTTLKLYPKPPVAEIVSPSLDADFCPELNFIMSSDDNNLISINLGYKRSLPNYSVHAQTLLMSDFGDYYSSAITASLALQAIQDQGIYNIMRLNFASVTPSQMAVKLAEYFSIVENSGVTDEDVFRGLMEFNTTASSVLHLEHIRYPTYLQLRREVELLGKIGMLAVGGNSNSWVLLDGFNGGKQLDGTYLLTISNPATASIDTVQFRELANSSEIFFNGSWQPVEMMILIGTDGWNSQITNFGIDMNRTDGWSYNWTPPNLWQGSDYYIQTKATEISGLKGYYTTMIHYDCTQFYLAGDYNNDGLTNIDDLNILISYFTNQGPPPTGGDSRADANCDNYLNITDIVYYLNYLFGSVSQPCY